MGMDLQSLSQLSVRGRRAERVVGTGAASHPRRSGHEWTEYSPVGKPESGRTGTVQRPSRLQMCVLSDADREGAFMRVRTIIVGIVAAAAMTYPPVAIAQNPTAAVNISSVVRGGVVVVSYDLVSSDPAAMYTVALEESSDGGKTYGVQQKTVKGDVGTSVHAGTGKQITWEVARDVENLEVDRYRYRVAAQLIRVQAETPPAQQEQQRQQQKGKGALWGGLAMIGGGAFLAI